MSRWLAPWTLGLLALAGFGVLAGLAPQVLGGQVPAVSVPWLPAIGVELGLRLDGLALLFAGLVLGIGVLVVFYSAWYLEAADATPRFYAFLALFMAAMLGLVLADNLILLTVCWELTSLSSFLLIGYWTHQPQARQGARMALAVTGGGGLALFAGVLLLGQAAGSYQLDAVLAAGESVRAHPFYLPALLLILLGAFSKSAQFPFHFWLPHAMAAPTPVSAYLHSATMVKAGVFLLARLHPVLAGTEPWFWIVSGTGITTLLIGAYIAVFQHDLKGLLAYSTISHLGLITLLLGLDTPLAVLAGVFHILNHAVFKASLFMAVGIIDHECATRDMRIINGLWRYMPYTATLAMTAAAAMAGVPLLNGFLSKEMFFAETLFVEGHPVIDVVVPLGATLAGAFAIAYSLRFVHDVFFNGEPRGLTRVPHEPPRWLKLPIELLVLLCLLIGLLPELMVGELLNSAAGAVLGAPPPPHRLALWHGFNWALGMSALAMVLGVAFYFSLQKLFRLHDLVHLPRGGREVFQAGTEVLRRWAQRLARGTEDSGLQVWLAILVLTAVLVVALPLVDSGLALFPNKATPVNLLSVLIWGLGVGAAVATVRFHRERFVALIPLGAVGLVVSLAFVGFSAPDLALTQLLVEVVSIILMMLTLHYLPGESRPEPGRGLHIPHAALALAAGLVMAGLTFAMLQGPPDSIAGFYLEKSLPEGGGANVVNVVIVDFRGFDTLGEISVLGIAALIVLGLLHELQPVRARAARQGSLILQAGAGLLLPLATLVTVHLFLRGHNAPGGGFVAGLVFAGALLVLYLARGSHWVEQRLAPRWPRWIAAGLLVAGGTGAGSALWSHPFLTSSFLHPELPWLGEVPIASAMFFDLGVFLTVVGATMLMLVLLGRLEAEAR